ncbi:MAG: lasso peptide biosynthesis B2 protein [Anaerolineales bacterium]|nr:lasso peptide biosynthesis B2 protein [Anaerolineales bacterium]
MKRKAQLARGFSLSDWSALIEAWLRLLYYRLALLAVNYQRLKESTRRIENQSSELSLPRARKIERLVGYAARLHLIPMTCLDKSLALQSMLSRRKIAAQIKIGAQKIEGTLYAHAWVEVNGKPIGEAEDVSKRFSALESVAEITNRQLI